MGFFNDLGKKASEAYNVTKEKTTKISGELKQKAKINECKNKIEEIEVEIGILYYEDYKAGLKGEKNDEITAKCEEITKLEEEIKKAEEEILAIKDIKKCVECGAELNINVEFCSKCGAKQPEIKKEEVAVTEEPAQGATEVKVDEVNNVTPEEKAEENQEDNKE